MTRLNNSPWISALMRIAALDMPSDILRDELRDAAEATDDVMRFLRELLSDRKNPRLQQRARELIARIDKE